jgi:allantoate deiminase
VEAEAVIMERLEELGRVSDEPSLLLFDGSGRTNRLTRLFASPAMKRANDLVASWMRDAGMTTRMDAVGNLIGRFSKLREDSKILLLGSHLDTVRNAGKFDGTLGVAVSIACVEEIRRRNQTLPFAIEVAALADEEGTRYQTAYLGSRALVGQLSEQDLALVDADKITMADAIRNFGGDPAKLKSCRVNGQDLLGYVEVHIEQGPVLEEKNQPVGVVTAIAGQTRATVILEGRSGHAGTTPMKLRRDALCAAADFILAAENYARQHPGMVATVGQIMAGPNVSNVIPGNCLLTLDLRHQEDAIRVKAFQELGTCIEEIENRRRVKAHSRIIQETTSVQCSTALSDLMRNAVRRHQPEVIDLVSGAGHDAAIMAKITPIAMLFVRCAGGVSHHPDESVRVDDIRVALDVLTDFVLSLPAPP